MPNEIKVKETLYYDKDGTLVYVSSPDITRSGLTAEGRERGGRALQIYAAQVEEALSIRFGQLTYRKPGDYEVPEGEKIAIATHDAAAAGALEGHVCEYENGRLVRIDGRPAGRDSI